MGIVIKHTDRFGDTYISRWTGHRQYDWTTNISKALEYSTKDAAEKDLRLHGIFKRKSITLVEYKHDKTSK